MYTYTFISSWAVSEAQAAVDAIIGPALEGKGIGESKITWAHVSSDGQALSSAEARRLRWFTLPSEALADLEVGVYLNSVICVCA